MLTREISRQMDNGANQQRRSPRSPRPWGSSMNGRGAPVSALGLRAYRHLLHRADQTRSLNRTCAPTVAITIGATMINPAGVPSRDDGSATSPGSAPAVMETARAERRARWGGAMRGALQWRTAGTILGYRRFDIRGLRSPVIFLHGPCLLEVMLCDFAPASTSTDGWSWNGTGT